MENNSKLTKKMHLLYAELTEYKSEELLYACKIKIDEVSKKIEKDSSEYNYLESLTGYDINSSDFECSKIELSAALHSVITCCKQMENSNTTNDISMDYFIVNMMLTLSFRTHDDIEYIVNLENNMDRSVRDSAEYAHLLSFSSTIYMTLAIIFWKFYDIKCNEYINLLDFESDNRRTMRQHKKFVSENILEIFAYKEAASMLNYAYAIMIQSYIKSNAIERFNIQEEHIQDSNSENVSRIIFKTIKKETNMNPQKWDTEPEIVKPEKLELADIYSTLNKKIIGQEETKKNVAMAIYKHLSKMNNPDTDLPDSNNLLLVGPTGCGKTEIMRVIKDMVNVPVIMEDANSLTPAAFRGRNIEDIFSQIANLLAQAKTKEEANRIEHAIIFIDEIDKIIKPISASESENLHDAVQSSLLTVLEGSDISVTLRTGIYKISTRNFLFVMAGAFEKSEFYDNNKKKSIGFGGSTENVGIQNKKIFSDILNEYGAKREFIGRIGSISVLSELSRENLIDIIKMNNISEKYKNLCELSNIDCLINNELYEKVVDTAIKNKTGARGVKSLCDSIISEMVFNAMMNKKDSVEISEKQDELKKYVEL